MNTTAVVVFLVFVAITLGITRWAARRATSRGQFYAAGGSLTGLQNGIAFAGEFLSAATFLGITALYFGTGYDGLTYSIGALMGMPVLIFLFADRLRQLGRYTLADVLTYRLQDPRLRVFSTCATAIVLLFYMVGQLVGAGALVDLLFGIKFTWSVCGIGVLMMIYVVFGGMVATSWIQIIKCGFLFVLGIGLAIGVLANFDFNLDHLFAAAVAHHKFGAKIMGPINLTSPGAALSAFLTQAVGVAGLPHLIMRFFTVPNEVEARRSANYATLLIGVFYVVLIIVGYGAVAMLSDNPVYTTSPGVLRNGTNMASLYLAHALGGDILLGVCAAAVFATILAVVAGLTLAVAAAVSHDLYATVLRHGTQSEAREMGVSRIAALVFAIISIALSIVFKDENVTFLIVTSLAVAASSTFPVLFLACFWRPLTASGAVIGGSIGLICAIIAIILGPTVWVAVFGNPAPIFPYQYPTIATLPIALIVTMAVSLLDRSRARRALV